MKPHPGPHAAMSAAGLTPDEALERLLEGNGRFVAAKLENPHRTAAYVRSIAHSQHPFAVLVGCADSRVAPEILFDQGLGDLFVNRVAGNCVSDDILGSIEYAVEHLGCSLVLVLGHERCGAIQAAIAAATAGATFNGYVRHFIEAIRPAVEMCRAQAGDLDENALRANVLRNVEKIKTASDIIHSKLLSGEVKVLGGRYDLDDGVVTLLG
ncbi:MAG: carbonic anhydrase [Aphanocapsa lilacina HA4352-LM1]|nr:carbonic anhydrase [Aphanocapsa lilacina HA4352-LM1]